MVQQQTNKIFIKDRVPYYVGLFENEYLETINKTVNVKLMTVSKISNQQANDFVYHHHYLHRKLYIGANISYGLYCGVFCVGVCMYGYPVWTEYPGLVPPLKSSECPELLRLSTMGGLPKNTESYFISKTIKLLINDWKTITGDFPKYITSFCDIGYGFNGALYKATNFKFYRETKGRPANPGNAHGKWHKNNGIEDTSKIMFIYSYDRRS